MLRSIGKQSGESVVSPKEEKVGYGGKDLQKRKGKPGVKDERVKGDG